ncbi:DNA polymerase Y family protein [Gluconacetobacter johannae]|uniref:DNA polymerase Y family protein n=2 Tax=Gluconacetobacter johannae TaxID=112140 RepID=A0A7W4J8Y0_9PROT|nr:DNA polymerase Y family protein [Gluconacetobacter johannae]MBB2176872.1 DNA polymerase Y family protein [Gluconacetobacter johannae]
MRRIVSLWLPFLPVERLRRRHALSPDRPLVTRSHDGRRQVIAAADPAARAQGVVPGQPLAQAQALVPDLQVLAADPDRDAADLARLAGRCLWMSPLTAPDGVDGIWIDASGCAHLHGGEPAMLGRLLDDLGRLGLSGRVAIADTPGAAHALARHGRSRLAVLPAGAPETLFDSLPVEALRIAGDTADMLHRLGLGRIGAVRAAPRAPLARRFGPLLLTRLDQMLGRVAEPIRPVLAPEIVQARRGFVEPISTPDAFRVVIDALVAEACTALRRRGEGARRLDLVFERVDGTARAVRVGTARAVHDPAHLGHLLAERIESVEPGFGVEAMRLLVTAAERCAPVQDGGGRRGIGDEADLSVLVDRLSNRLGPERVFRLAPVATHVPERRQRRVPADRAGGGGTWSADWPRPIRLLPAPEPVRVTALLPDHPPRAFIWRRSRHEVVRADGPERILGEWWRPATDADNDRVREYWTVEDRDGRRFWLFRRGDGQHVWSGDQGWFLHGFF